MDIPNLNWMDDIHVLVKERKTPKPKTSRSGLQAQLHVIEIIHQDDLIVGYATTFNLPEDQLTIEYYVDWHGKYGWNASIMILCDNTPSSQMSIKRAYEYIRLGSSIRDSRTLMKYLPYD